MLNERYLVTGKRVDNGEEVTGYLFADTATCSLKGKGKCSCTHDGSISYIFAWEDELHEYNDFEVDPTTIEPIAAPVKHERTAVGGYRCPNCNAAFIDGAGTTPYCGNCGQRLDWNEADKQNP